MKYSNTNEGISGRKNGGGMKRMWVCVAAGLMAVVMAAGCVEENGRETPSSGILVNLTIDKAPALNETAELTLSVITPRNASNVSAKIILPEGLELVSGDLYWHGALIENETQSIYAKVRAVKIGDWTIDGAVTGGSDQIYLSILENEGRITERPLQNFTRGKKYAEAK